MKNERPTSAKVHAKRKPPWVPKYIQRRAERSIIYLILFIAFMAFAVGVYKGGIHLVRLKPEQITLSELPSALALSFMRMLASYIASLFFSFFLGLIAARSALGERMIIPLLDILQSIPVVGFFPAAISFFIGMTHGHRLGIEMAAVFLIFTSQAWNMAFAVYEATKTIPQDNLDAVASFGVKGSQRFWKLFAPACVPRLIYNSILSWSNGWFFLVACEIIAEGPIRYHLPGIGSFLARAAEQDQLRLVFWGLIALSILILGLDLVIWRPLSVWADRFRQDYYSSTPKNIGLFPMSQKAFVQKLSARLGLFRPAMKRMLFALSSPLVWFLKEILLPLLWDLPAAIGGTFSREIIVRVTQPTLTYWSRLVKKASWTPLALLWCIGAFLGITAGFLLFHWLKPPWPEMIREIPMAILASTARLITALILSFAWTLPVILGSWNRPRLRQALTTVAQVGASLPATALFPLIILIAIRRFGGGMEIASIVLLLTGMQWYILFNGLGGAAIIPYDLVEAARAMVQIWRKLVLPALRPALITGAITAWGGGWNALVVSEYVSYKNQILKVKGLGALLNQAVLEMGDDRAIALCIASMVGWILIINSILWRPLYHSAAERYKFDA